MSSPDPNLATDSGPLVSVSITAFNSENWLPRAIDSAINQQTDFPIEIVIADDCSTDSTLRVAHSYRERYPNVIRVLERCRNIGIQRNYYDTFEQCRGKYIAWLDSDDFWTDPEKLAIQVQTLESDPSLNVCGHFVRWVSPDGEVKRERYPSIAPGRYGLAEIIHHNFLPSLSVMFRNGIHRNLPTWYFDLAPTTDWPIFVLAALSGDIVLLDRVMADYMLAPGSSLMSKGSLFWYTKDARFYEKIESILPSTWQRIARAEKGKRYESMAYLLRKQGDFVASREAAFKAFCSPSLVDNSGSKIKSLLAAVVRETQWRLRGKPAAEAK
jgi:glycosyltransferase involved in cell wall biosynthesis